MDLLNITLEDGTQRQVHGLFYLYNSKYYFIYTENEVDEKGYVVLHLSQVGKEVVNTPSGRVDTGNMIGVEISDPEEWKMVQASITKIVDDKKNNRQSPEITYFNASMVNGIKILSKKTFRLLKTLIADCFNLNIEETAYNQNDNQVDNGDEIIDYRSSYFEEQSRNKMLQSKVDDLSDKIARIKEIIE